MKLCWRQVLLVMTFCGSFAAVMLFPPIVQDQSYHRFADRRAFAGVPNFIDVATNVPFLVIGIAGVLFGVGNTPSVSRRSWTVFFTAVALVGVGSAYYHMKPNDQSLLWDRMPMTVGFVSVLVAVLSERVCGRIERYALGPAIAAGLFSVAWWVLSGDLRPYIFIQVLPLIALPAAVVLDPERDRASLFIIFAVVLYTLAKVLEFNDQAIYVATRHSISGHSLKHLAAAAGCGALLIKQTLIEKMEQAALETSVSGRSKVRCVMGRDLI